VKTPEPPTAQPSTPPTCEGKGRDGAPCRATPQSRSAYCINHDPDPEARERVAAGRRAGGLRRAAGLRGEPLPPLPPKHQAPGEPAPPPEPDPPWMTCETINDTRAGFGWAIRKLARGEIQAREANALFLGLAGLARVIEGSEVAEKVEELRRAMGLDQKGKQLR